MSNYNFEIFSKQELIDLLSELYQFEISKEMIDRFIKEKTNVMLNEYKKRLEDLFFPVMGIPVSNLTISDALVEEYHENSNDNSVEFDMFYLEMLLEYLHTYGMMGQEIFNKMLALFIQIVEKGNSKYTSRLEFVCGTMGYMDPVTQEKMQAQLKNLAIHQENDKISI